MKSPLCLRGGRILDPARGVDRAQDLWIDGGKIAGWGEDAPAALRSRKDVEVIDVRGAIVCPGLVDIHVHLREPGQEDKETIETGTRAAVRGGFTAVACMPNTDPPLDERPRIEYVLRRAEEAGLARVMPIAAVTKGQMGEQLTEIEDLVSAGAVAISDDGKPVRNAEIMRRALELTRELGIPVIQHAEDPDLKGIGVMHEGWVSTRTGLKGIPAIAESVMVARDALLSELTGGRVHVAHVSAARSVEIIRKAKARGIRMTGETTPHYLVLTDEAVAGYNPNAKMNPPLRSASDRDALIEGIVDGTIDCLATDHAPHTAIEKDNDFDSAPFGIVGLETALGIYLSALVDAGHLTLPELIAKMTVKPYEVLGRSGGTLAPGADADVTVFDPSKRWTVRASEFASKGRNTPFDGWELPGRVLLTVVGGRPVYRADLAEATAR
ncbi:MAG: dihydroorotase [Candidatus Eiseniibacteriota bacterium]